MTGMNIALIGKYNQSDILPGPDKFAKNIFKRLQQDKVEVVFLTYFFKSIQQSNIYSRIIGREELNNTPHIICQGIIRTLFYLFLNKIQILHVVTFERFLIPLILLRKLFRFRIVYTFHGIISEELIPGKKLNLKDKYLEKLLFKNSDIIIFPSLLAYSIAVKYYAKMIRNFEIVPHGISSPTYRQIKNIKQTGLINIVTYSGMDLVIDRKISEIINLLEKSKLKNVKVFNIGTEYKTKVNQKFDIENIKPLNEQNFFEFLADKHFYIGSNINNTFSLIAGECMALGMIVFVPENTGLAEYLKNGYDSFVYQADKPKEIVKIIKELSVSSAKYKSISENAVKIVEKINWEKTVKQYKLIYKNILNEN